MKPNLSAWAHNLQANVFLAVWQFFENLHRMQMFLMILKLMLLYRLTNEVLWMDKEVKSSMKQSREWNKWSLSSPQPQKHTETLCSVGYCLRLLHSVQRDFPYIVNLLAEGFNLQQTNRVTSISTEGTREVLTWMFAPTQKPALRGELTKKTLLWFKSGREKCHGNEHKVQECLSTLLSNVNVNHIRFIRNRRSQKD